LKTASDLTLVRSLAQVADVVIENYRPGTLARLGLDYAEVAATNPAVVWCSISGFGQDGPYRDRPAYDMIVQALSGGMSLTGLPDGPPVRSGIPLGDLAAGMFAAIGTLASLRQRADTGRGRHVDISMLDCQISMLSYQGVYHLLAGAMPGRQGRAHDSIPTYRGFTAADGVDIMITANTERMWHELCRVLDVTRLLNDPRFVDGAARQAHRGELDPVLEYAFRARTAVEWLPLLHAAGIPAAPVNTVADALDDPHVRHRRMVRDVEGDNGRPRLRLLGNPVKFCDSGPERPFRSPPKLGQDRQQVVDDWLDTNHDQTSDARD
jgi:crotonobetainyl-CoA:carnitine CoA-transferase CaiB-like acyl-CoA transferase